ncbi:hypothetical protein [Mycobacterium sp. DL440]|uniref:hypothetical protein n=1 Tax=Mycobacterium sp. DL440 TaxID=2675523 RepID=UPI0014234C23|nr:hypothetical protein [Mycobacterium sp. DL440]
MFASLLAKALFDRAVEYVKDPANREDVESASTWLLERFAGATPWKWDDKVIKALADQLGAKIPGLDGLSTAVAQLQQFVSRLPNLGGLFSGGR